MPIFYDLQNETFFGDGCECDNISCERDNNGNICGGSGRGNCGCNGTCTCINRWSGSACDCTPDQDNCLSNAVSMLFISSTLNILSPSKAILLREL